MKYYKIYDYFFAITDRRVIQTLTNTDGVYLYNKINDYYPNQFKWIVKYIKLGKAYLVPELINLKASLIFGKSLIWKYDSSLDFFEQILKKSTSPTPINTYVRLKDRSKHFISISKIENNYVFFEDLPLYDTYNYGIFLRENPQIIVKGKYGSGKISKEDLIDKNGTSSFPLYFICNEKDLKLFRNSNPYYLIAANELAYKLIDLKNGFLRLFNKDLEEEKIFDTEVEFLKYFTKIKYNPDSKFNKTKYRRPERKKEKDPMPFKYDTHKYYHEAYLRIGEGLMSLKKFEEAIKNFEAAIKLKADYHQAHYYNGICYMNIGKYEDALTYFFKSLESENDKVESLDAIGKIYLEKGKTEESLQFFKKALELDDNYWPAHFGIGMYFTTKSEFEKAIYHYQRCLEIDGHREEILLNLGACYFHVNQKSRAVSLYKKAKELYPDSIENIEEMLLE